MEKENKVSIQKNYEITNDYRILIIQNCTKKKKLTRNSFSLYQLKTRTQRQEILKSTCSKLPAKQLFFTKEMNETVEFLRKNNYHVDYYFLSTGFGLVNENDELPAYDCTFTRKAKQWIHERADELQISESIEKLPYYSLIYLSLSRHYLYAINLAKLQEKAKEIVYFNSQMDYRFNLICVNELEFKKMSNEFSNLPIKLQNNLKEYLLKNFAVMKNKDEWISFKDFLLLLLDKRPYIKIN